MPNDEPRAPLVPPTTQPSVMDLLQALVQQAGSGAGWHGVMEPMLPGLPSAIEEFTKGLPRNPAGIGGSLPGLARGVTEFLNPTPLSVVLDVLTSGTAGKAVRASRAGRLADRGARSVDLPINPAQRRMGFDPTEAVSPSDVRGTSRPGNLPIAEESRQRHIDFESISRVAIPTSPTVRVARTVDPATAITTHVTGRGKRAIEGAQRAAIETGVAPAVPRRAATTTTAHEADEIIAGNKILDKKIKQVGGKPERVKEATRADLNLANTQLRRTKNALSDLVSQLDPPTAEKIRALTKNQQGEILKMGPDKGLQALGLEPNSITRLAFDVMQLDQAVQFQGTGVRNLARKAEREALNELGAAAQQLTRMMARSAVGGTVGGSVGAATTENPDEKLGRAVLGFAVGAGIPGALKIPLKKGGLLGKTTKTTGDVLNDVQIFNMLGSVGTIGRAYAGTVSNTFQLATRAVLEGRGSKVPAAIREVMSSQTAKNLVDSYKHPERASGFLVDRAPAGLLTRIPTSALQWADDTSIRFGKKLGFDPEVIRDGLLTGEPATKLGQKAVGLARGINETVGMPVLPFARTGVKSFERGFAPFMPESAFVPERIPSTAERAFGQAQVFGGADVAARAEPLLPEGSERGAAAAMGPAALPFTSTLAAVRDIRRSDNPLATTPLAVGSVIAESLGAGGGRGLETALTPSTLGSRFTPGFLAEIARFRDPAFGRETGREELQEAGQGPIPSLFGGAQARVPGLREQLTETGVPLDVTGQPRVDPDRSGGERALFPVGASLTAQPGLPTGEPALPDRPSVNEARRLGIDLSTPGRTIKVEGIAEEPVQIADVDRRQIEAEYGQEIFVEMDDLVTSRFYQDLSDEEKVEVYKIQMEVMREALGDIRGSQSLDAADRALEQQERP